MTENQRFLDVANDFVSWCRDDALPYWAATARDDEGGFYEALDMDGAPMVDRERRLRVEWRQTYTYAHANQLGWFDGDDVSRKAFDYMLRYGANGNAITGDKFSGFAHRVNADGSVSDDRRDTYDHAFAVLACAWRIGVFNDQDAAAVVENTFAYIDSALRTEDGSYKEGLPHSLPRRQNPHMHLFEATTTLAAFTQKPEHRARADAFYNLFTSTFLDTEEGVLREFFSEDWSLDPTTGHLIEPGHMAEWSWLLQQYEKMSGVQTKAVAEMLYTNAVKMGRDPKSGYLVDEIALGAPFPERHTRRTWVQTEYLKGTLAMIQWGHDDLYGRAADIIELMMRDYLRKDISGGYIDRFDQDGNMVSTDMPVSTLYHLISAAAETHLVANLP